MDLGARAGCSDVAANVCRISWTYALNVHEVGINRVTKCILKGGKQRTEMSRKSDYILLPK